MGLGPGGLVWGRRWPSCSSTALSRGEQDGRLRWHQQCPACLSVCPQRGPCVLCGTAGTGWDLGVQLGCPVQEVLGGFAPHNTWVLPSVWGRWGCWGHPGSQSIL